MNKYSLYNIIQNSLLSIAMAAMVIAFVSIFIGRDNVFQETPYPFIIIILAVNTWLFSGKQIDQNKE